METQDPDWQRLQAHIAQLSEHYDSVQIFVTWKIKSDEGQPMCSALSLGAGNIYARQGHIREWQIQQDHRAKLFVEQQDSDEDDDGEEV